MSVFTRGKYFRSSDCPVLPNNLEVWGEPRTSEHCNAKSPDRKVARAPVAFVIARNRDWDSVWVKTPLITLCVTISMYTDFFNEWWQLCAHFSRLHNSQCHCNSIEAIITPMCIIKHAVLFYRLVTTWGLRCCMGSAQSYWNSATRETKCRLRYAWWCGIVCCYWKLFIWCYGGNNIT